MNNHIDLHLHTTASDGSDTVLELLEKIRRFGVHTCAITDHDTIDAALELQALAPSDIHFVTGIEFSCTTSYKKCHILGYDFDPSDTAFQEALALGVQLRQEKLHRRIEFLKSQFGITLTEKELDWLRSQKSPGRPHFGKLIVDRNLAPDLRTAITQYINPCKDGNDRIPASIAIQAILHAGGVPVWAHPLGGEGDKRLSQEEFLIQLQNLMNAGIRGLECYYSRYEQDDIQFLAEQATANHLLISGGSDYHGHNKPNLHIGKLNASDALVAEEQITLCKHLKERRF